MRELFKYRDNCYFNDTDHFLADNGLNGFYLTKLELYNGEWVPKQYKGFRGGYSSPNGHWIPMNWFYNSGCYPIVFKSTPSINCNELLGMEVEYKGTGIKGVISKFLLHNIGVNWYQGQGELKRKFGMPHFWTEPKYLKFT